MAPGEALLVVDDEVDVRESFSVYFEQMGIRALGAANGQEALDLLHGGERPCVILLDLMMPVMDGWEFRRKQLQDPDLAAIPVIVVTARGDVHLIEQKLGVVAALHKPVDLDRLEALVAQHC